MNQTMEVERGLSNLPVPGVVPFRAAGRAAAAALRGGVRRVGVVADHRNAGERLHDQLLDGRRHVAARETLAPLPVDNEAEFIF